MAKKVVKKKSEVNRCSIKKTVTRKISTAEYESLAVYTYIDMDIEFTDAADFKVKSAEVDEMLKESFVSQHDKFLKLVGNTRFIGEVTNNLSKEKREIVSLGANDDLDDDEIRIKTNEDMLDKLM